MDENDSLNNVRSCHPPAQYIQASMYHSIDCNIVDIANQLSFAYHDIALEFKVFISLHTKVTKTFDFIRVFVEKQDVWHKMIAISITQNQYYNNFCRLFIFRPFLSSQFKAFICH